MIDPNLFSGNNRPRNRRLAFHASLVLGAIAGAVMYREIGPAFATFASGVVKALVTFMLAFNKAHPPKKETLQSV